MPATLVNSKFDDSGMQFAIVVIGQIDQHRSRRRAIRQYLIQLLLGNLGLDLVMALADAATCGVLEEESYRLLFRE